MDPSFFVTLPWPRPSLPVYREGTAGPWSIAPTPAIDHRKDGDSVAGYFLPHLYQPPGWVIKYKGESIWMSLTAMEIESHMPHLAAARGNVVVAGLGMGFALANIAAKSNVTKVTVLEQNPDIPKLLDVTTDWHNWPGHEKVELVIGDALTYKPDQPVDFLYADIWPKLWDDNALRDTITMQRNINAKLVGYWGQEGDYVDHHRVMDGRPSITTYRRFAAHNNLPLIEQNRAEYPVLAFAAIALQIMAKETNNELKDKMRARYVQLLSIVSRPDPISEAIRSVLL